MVPEPSVGIDTQGLATFEAKQRVLVTEEPPVSPVSTLSAAEHCSASVGASSSIADTLERAPDTVFGTQSASEAGSEHKPETGRIRSI